MIRIAITVEAYGAMVATLPLGSVGYEPQLNAKGERLIWIEARWQTSSPPCARPARATATSSCG
jgi:hypothetical protein